MQPVGDGFDGIVVVAEAAKESPFRVGVGSKRFYLGYLPIEFLRHDPNGRDPLVRNNDEGLCRIVVVVGTIPGGLDGQIRYYADRGSRQSSPLRNDPIYFRRG